MWQLSKRQLRPTRKENTRKCNNVPRQARRHSTSIGMVFGWIHHKIITGTLQFHRINGRCSRALRCSLAVVIEMQHLTVRFRLVCSTCGLAVHRQENVKLRVDQIRYSVGSRSAKSPKKSSRNVVTKREFTRHRETCT